MTMPSESLRPGHFDRTHLLTLMGWFTSPKQLCDWSGPSFNYPFTEQSFLADLTRDGHLAISLVNERGELAAYGQCYLRLERLHLARLAVAPQLRGQNRVEQLINTLSPKGFEQFGQRDQSLFVLVENHAAIKAYHRLGFIEARYPEKIQFDNCLYMIRSC